MTSARLILAAICGVAAAYAAALVYEMDFAPPGCCKLAWPHDDPVATTRWQNHIDPNGRNAATQRKASLAVLSAEPANANAWMRLAWADWLEHGRLTKAGAAAVDMSYAVKLYAFRDAPWRIGFVLDNWTSLDARAQRAAMTEMALARNDTAVRLRVHRGPRDPAGKQQAERMGLTYVDP